MSDIHEARRLFLEATLVVSLPPDEVVLKIDEVRATCLKYASEGLPSASFDMDHVFHVPNRYKSDAAQRYWDGLVVYAMQVLMANGFTVYRNTLGNYVTVTGWGDSNA